MTFLGKQVRVRTVASIVLLLVWPASVVWWAGVTAFQAEFGLAIGGGGVGVTWNDARDTGYPETDGIHFQSRQFAWTRQELALLWPDAVIPTFRRDISTASIPLWALQAVALWMVWRGPFRRAMWLRTGRCPACGYPGTNSARCSECGALLPPNK